MSRAETKISGWKRNVFDWLKDRNPPGQEVSGLEPEILAPLLLRFCNASKRPLAAVFPLLALADDINFQLHRWSCEFSLSIDAAYLPETGSGKRFIPENEAERARLLYRVLNDCPRLITGSIVSFLTPTPPLSQVRDSRIELHTGMDIPFEDLLRKLVEMDYDDEFEVNVPGEFSRRGGIIDIFSPSHDFPVRLEFWGDTIDSMREFSPETQRSCGEVGAYTVISRAGIASEPGNEDFFTFLDSVKPELVIVFPEQCTAHLERFGSETDMERWKDILKKTPEERIIRLLDVAESAKYPNAATCGCFPATGHLRDSAGDEADDGASTELLRQITASQISQWLDTGYQVALLGINESSLDHIREWCETCGIPPDTENLEITEADLPNGVILPARNQVFLTEKELFSAPHRRKVTTSTPKVTETKEELMAAGFADLDESDFAVHVLHGIGIFKGITEIESMGAKEEVIEMEYADNATLYVPIWQSHLVSRYIGAKKGYTPLSKIGGRKWSKDKVAATRAVRSLAVEMLRMQAIRAASEGFSFPDDDVVQRMFDDAFPFEDTPDQVRSTREIKEDMTSNKPMDRLLCGDAGYGKTEVAIRAAFKAVMAGRQVALLVPTTVLAQQHYYSFCERLIEYPIIVDMLSRFRTKAEQREILYRLSQKKVDIIIGTHRLIQDDVEFSDLGLVIIDEEQRFGVEHKEKFKRFRSTVDVLTMTATPIPRTLHMAMTGVRDLSTIITAPGKRLPVQTVVSQYDENLIRSAIEREIQRGGQVFYLHNRVKTIQQAMENLEKLFPEANFATAHGQMPEDELEQVMADFLDGKVDVLVCTTIVESGLDIPNANTIIIERSDRFGLAELYQLRGRVGRWNRQAYAYLLLPVHEILTGDARKRIAAIRRYTHLGAGFKLALRDLEIRGTGNLLGAEQSGHINNIGFDLYCQLLRSTVAQLQGKPDEVLPEVEVVLDFIDFALKPAKGKTAASIPVEYIPSERLRIDAYRRLSGFTKIDEIDAFAEELRDRFGKLPHIVEVLLKIGKLRIMAAHAGFHSLKVKDDAILLEGPRGLYKRLGKLPKLNPKSPTEVKLDQISKLLWTLVK